MFIKIFSKVYLATVRYLIYRSLSKKRKSYPQKVYEIMGKFERKLIEDKHLNSDLTVGPVPVYSKQSTRLVNAFITNHAAKQEDDFYIQVAKLWVKDYVKGIHRAVSITVLLFLLCWFTVIYFNSYMTNFTEDLFHLALFLLPLVGFIISIFGKGWRAFLFWA